MGIYEFDKALVDIAAAALNTDFSHGVKKYLSERKFISSAQRNKLLTDLIYFDRKHPEFKVVNQFVDFAVDNTKFNSRLTHPGPHVSFNCSGSLADLLERIEAHLAKEAPKPIKHTELQIGSTYKNGRGSVIKIYSSAWDEQAQCNMYNGKNVYNPSRRGRYFPDGRAYYGVQSDSDLNLKPVCS